MTDKLQELASGLQDIKSLRLLLSELNFDYEDEPVNNSNWTEDQKKLVRCARIVAKKHEYLIFYIRTETDSLKDWKGIASKIIKKYLGQCIVCSHNPKGIKWAFSSLSKEFSKEFSETRHISIDINPQSKAPKPFVEFLEKIRVAKRSSTASIIAQVSDAFDSFAIQIHDELTVNVFEALKILSEGILTDQTNDLVLDQQTLEAIREPVFILLYRIMFVLYAEDRGVFPDTRIYHNKFSIKWIKSEWILKQHNNIKEYQVYQRLKDMFRLIEVGSEGLDYDPDEFCMRSYYGRLFDKKIHHKLDKWKIPNKSMLSALSLLTRTSDKQGNWFFLDYAALETRHLGAIYERLLEYHLDVRDGQIADLPNPKERKSTGSYYTPQYIVDYIVENTVGPLIDNIVKKNTPSHDPIEQILDLNILDPAMGSGHFLVGVVNYMARRICEIEGAVSEDEFNERKRDVARRCVYGVDLNPLAADLAAVSLWLETLSSEKPLSFLSAHLKSGNSLIGTSIDNILEKQTTLTESSVGRTKFRKTVRDFIMLETLEDDTAAAVKTKIEKYANMKQKGTVYHDLKFLLDAKVAESFGIDVQQLANYAAKIGQNSLDFYAEGSPWQEAARVAAEHSFFHWDLEFPDIFYGPDGQRKENPGFDAVVGNPPWDILNPDIEEFFAPLHDQKNQNKFRQLTKMQKDEYVKSTLTNTLVARDWKQYCDSFKKPASYFNTAYRFQVSLIGGKKHASHVNLYKLFLEKSYDILNTDGLCGLVMPAGIYSDLGTRGLRVLLFQNTRIKHLYSFINTKSIFKSIHRQFKFCVLIFVKGGSTEKFRTAFYLDDATKLQTINSKRQAFYLDLDLIKSSSPNAMSLIECKSEAVAQILRKMYAHPILNHGWNIQARSEFNMTNDSNLFNTNNGIPLFTGKMIYQFSNTLADPRYWINEEAGITRLTKKKRRIKNNELSTQLDYQYYRLVWRDVTNSVDRRTMIATILPPRVFLGHTLSYIRPTRIIDSNMHPVSLPETAYLCGMLNSFPVDFILRHRVNLHASIFHVMELPIPKFNIHNIWHKVIYQNTARLVCTSKEFSVMAKELKITGEKDPKKRLELQALINTASCHIYGIHNNELKLILEYFEVEDEALKKQTLQAMRYRSHPTDTDVQGTFV